MHTSKIQKSKSSNSHTSKSFFNKSGESNFFSESKETNKPFFGAHPIQAILNTRKMSKRGKGKTKNKSGMPDSLKIGLEQLSGLDLSRVRVHTNSSKPSQINALAYTQGQDIHLGPGQDKHLPHEGWHVVQQMQGRVKPTIHAKGVSINDNMGLEREADQMGDKALQMKGTEQATMGSAYKGPTSLHRERETKCESDVPGATMGEAGKEVPLQLQSVMDDSCPPYERHEVQKSRTGEGHLDTDIWQLGGNELLVADFGVDRRSVKTSTASEPTLRAWLAEFESNPLYRNLDIKGYDDCRGTAESHLHLRKGRARRVHDMLGPSTKSRTKSVAAAPAGTYVAGNQSIGARAQNRGVVIKYVRDANIEFPEEVVESTPRPKDPKSKDCSRNEKNRLAVAFSAAESMIQNAFIIISRMTKGSEQETLFKKYFGEDAFSHRRHILLGFSDTYRQWKNRRIAYPFVCVKQGAGECTPGRKGYVEFIGWFGINTGVPKGNIHICEEAFDYKDSMLAAVLIHEISHRLDWTSDREYCRNGGCSLDTKEAEDNADSYAQFAREAFERWN